MRTSSRLLTIDGTALYAESVGQGDPVLVLHGGFCSLESLRRQADALAGEFTVHAYERPGHGRSPDVPGGYDYAAWTEQAVRCLDDLGIAEAHVVGFSDGAVLGLLLALHHPHRVRSLVAISGNLDPSAFTDPPPRADVVAEPQEDRERAVYERLSPDGPAHADVVLAKLHRLWTTQPHIDPVALRGIRAPTLVVSGDRDTIHPDHSRLIAAHIPAAELCLVPDATHDLVAEHPELLTGLIRRFLRAQQTGSAEAPRPDGRSTPSRPG